MSDAEIHSKSINISINQSIKLFIHPSKHLPTYLPTDIPTDIPTYLPTYLPTYIPTYLPTYVHYHYGGADKSSARPTPRCIFFDGENNSFDASLVLYIY